MLFTSFTFVVFFTLVFTLYWFVFNRSPKLQNFLVLAASYLFYAWWDWRFLFLLVFSSGLTYFLGIEIDKSKSEKHRRFLLWIGVLQGLGCLAYFKYSNFFIESFVSIGSIFHITADIHTANIIFPLGISFYTFRMLSYLLDIKSGKFNATSDWLVFFSYVAFFSCLISGPVDRPKTLIPQLQQPRVFDYDQAADSMRRILWGLFKKIVIADNCAFFSDQVFNHYQTLPASSLLFGAFMFTIQVYADFSGYSDMAIGLSALLGFKVTRNFDAPFFAQNIADFWRRWHISLTSWLTDYVFTPLSIYFRRYGKLGLIMAILINFTAIGIWHGANWTFVLFGFLNGCYFIPLILRGSLNKRKKVATRLAAVLNTVGTFVLVMLTFILFRSESVAQAFDYYRRLFSDSIFVGITITEKVNAISTITAIVVMFLAEWLQRNRDHVLQIDFIRSPALRIFIYIGVILFILSFSPAKNADFIYFKF